MIISLLVILCAFVWLLKETDYLRVRLPIGAPTKSKPIDFNNPYYWQSDKTNLMLCINCRLKCKEHKSERWCGWKLPAKTIKAFNSTLNLNEGCNIYRAKFLKELVREHKRKTPAFKPSQLSFNPIEQVRIGSHKEWHENTYHAGHGYHSLVEDYNTVYHDCLVPGDWIKAHEHDLDNFEPTIELKVSDKSFNVNGNYKKGIIKEFIKANK